MPNGTGLAGSDGASQAALIVPFPDDPQRYYLFTNGAYWTDTPTMYPGVAYSVVDMGLNGGLGDVVAAQKNIPLRANVTEKLTATRHTNGKDVWVIMHGYGNAEYYAYLVTCAGIGEPVVSVVGREMVNSFSGDVADGWMQMSPQGDRLAATWANDAIPGEFHDQGCLDVLRFNRTTGVLSDPIMDTFSGGGFQSKGVCFSASGDRLYRTQVETYGMWSDPATWDVRSYVYQYDLTSSDPMGTEVRVAEHVLDNFMYSAMQRSPAGRIIIGRVNGAGYSSINDPDQLGAACDFQEYGGSYMGFAMSYMSMPNVWDMHPPMNDAPPFSLADITLCNGESITIDTEYPVTTDGVSYIWSTGDTSASIQVQEGGIISVEVGLPCVSYFDTVLVTIVDCDEPEPVGEVVVPNVFSPNGDANNEGFGVVAEADLPNYRLDIFNRWGNPVFTTSSVQRKWSGQNMDGTNASEGVYYWVLGYGPSSEPRRASGHVTLLR
jgi:gliding motility-associated-like protein